VEDLLLSASVPRAQQRTVARKGGISEPALHHPVDEIDFGFLNDDCSISDIVRVQR
jgi:hypothetical protein